MTLRWHRDAGKNNLSVNGLTFTVTNLVRNELNGWRKLHVKKEVALAIPSGKPYMPRQFPKGTWEVTKVERYKLINGVSNFDKSVYGTERIRTNAHQAVEVWELDSDGGYSHKNETFVEDYGYLLHNAMDSNTTLGCGNVVSKKEMSDLATLVEALLESGKVYLEVV